MERKLGTVWVYKHGEGWNPFANAYAKKGKDRCILELPPHVRIHFGPDYLVFVESRLSFGKAKLIQEAALFNGGRWLEPAELLYNTGGEHILDIAQYG